MKRKMRGPFGDAFSDALIRTAKIQSEEFARATGGMPKISGSAWARVRDAINVWSACGHGTDDHCEHRVALDDAMREYVLFAMSLVRRETDVVAKRKRRFA
jgi:hypothetical protein